MSVSRCRSTLIVALVVALAHAGCLFGLDTSGEASAVDRDTETGTSGDATAADVPAADADIRDTTETLDQEAWLRRRLENSKWFAIVKENESDDVGQILALHLFGDGTALFSGCTFHTGQWSLQLQETGAPSVRLSKMAAKECDGGGTEHPPTYATVIGAGSRDITNLALKGGADAQGSLDMVAPGSADLEVEDLAPRWEAEESANIRGTVQTVTVFLRVLDSRIGTIGYSVSAFTRRPYRRVPLRLFVQGSTTYWTAAPEQPRQSGMGDDLVAIGGRVEWKGNAASSTLYAPFVREGAGPQATLEAIELEYVESQ